MGPGLGANELEGRLHDGVCLHPCSCNRKLQNTADTNIYVPRVSLSHPPLHTITNSIIDMCLSKLWEMVKDREA